MKNITKSKYFLIIAGLLCGTVNGLLGAGGGIVAVWSLRGALKDELSEERDVFANALCIMLPISAVSCISYAIRGNLSTGGIGLYIVPAIIGGVIGGVLLGRIKAHLLRRLFSILVVISGILLIIR